MSEPDYSELIGSEWADKDSREQGRVIQIVAIVPGLDDGYGGPVFNAVTVANPSAWKVGRRTKVGLHGLKRRWYRPS